MDYQIAYLTGTLVILMPIWLTLFIFKKSLRKEIIITSLIIGTVGVLSEVYYTRDYWNPQVLGGEIIGFEDFIFGFFIGGISSTLYEALFGKMHSKKRDGRYRWNLFTVPFLLVFYLILKISVAGFNLNSIYASIIGFLVLAFILIFFRKDLVADSLISGILFGIVMLFGYFIFLYLYPEAINRWWQLGNISGMLYRGIPVEELAWAFSWGMFAGPMYEFFTGLKYKS